MWNGSSTDIPAGWVLCDGTKTYVDLNGITKTVPNLSGRFVLANGSGTGLTTRNIGDIGGEENHKLTIDEMPSHNHNFNYLSLSSGGNFMPGGYGSLFSNLTTNTGGNKPNNNMPPFYVLCYICYIGDL